MVAKDSACSPKKPLPVLISHGLKKFLPYGLGHSSIFQGSNVNINAAAHGFM